MSGLKVFQDGEVISADDLNYNFGYINKLQNSITERNFVLPTAAAKGIPLTRLGACFNEYTVVSQWIDATTFNTNGNTVKFALDPYPGGSQIYYQTSAGIYGDASMADGPLDSEGSLVDIDSITVRAPGAYNNYVSHSYYTGASGTDSAAQGGLAGGAGASVTALVATFNVTPATPYSAGNFLFVATYKRKWSST